ncbi:MAG TPA: ester cyclase [Pyrinomonadaceae bacterium]|nr:ester cyclase [Pyrinomonadaceae bacterium]
MSEANKELIRRWFEEVWNKGRADAIDEMIDENCIIHGLGDATGQPVTGPSEYKSFYATFRQAFPEITVSVEDTVAEGDMVAARCAVYGKHAGDSLGIKASEAPVDFTGITIVRVKDGRIAEAWNNFDFMRMYRQIGAI